MTTSGEQGLSAAEVEKRVGEGKVNRTTSGTERTLGEILRANVLTPVNAIMVTLFVVIVIAGYPQDGLFVGVVFANVVIGVWQELKARRELHRLEVLNAASATVLRDGQESEIEQGDVVLDDVLIVGSGDQIVADGEVIDAVGLSVDESLLTGESDPIEKQVGDEVKSGSFVAAGSGRVRTTAVGSESYANSLAAEAKQFELVNSELRRGINAILRVLIIVIPPVSLLLLWSLMRAQDRWQDSVQGTVAAAVAMVPDGLVLLTSLAFLAGIIALTRQRALAKELATVELLARVDTLCLDKTGTITTGEIRFASVVPLGDNTEDDVLEALGAIAHTDPDPNSTMRAVRDAVDGADWNLIDSKPFSSANKWSATRFDDRGSFYFGAPDVLFAQDDVVLEQIGEQSGHGFRVLGLASSTRELGDQLPQDHEPVALILLEDDIRSDAPEILRFFHEQGVTIKIISGDNVDTVAAVAERAGVRHAEQRMDARELPESDQELARVLDETTVFGRVTPHQKRAMVGALKSGGHVVAMTGDGVNDVLALKDADMGIAMGSGSSASRGVAQLVLLDNRFATLPEVLAQGRRVINNIERVANLFVAKAVYAVLLALLIGIQQAPFPLLPRQLTLIGTFSIGIPGFFLALAASDALVKPGFLRRVLQFSIPAGIIAGLTTWGVYAVAESDAGTPLEEARSIATITLLLLGLVILVIASRPLRTWKIGLAAAMAASYAAIVAIGPLRRYFEIEPPSTYWWLVTALCAGGGGLLIALIPQVIAGFEDSRGDVSSPDDNNSTQESW